MTKYNKEHQLQATCTDEINHSADYLIIGTDQATDENLLVNIKF